MKAWATWSEERLRSVPELNPEAVRRLLEVQRLQGVLELHTRVLELHRDADFQMDAKVPRVIKAIEAVRASPGDVRE